VLPSIYVSTPQEWGLSFSAPPVLASNGTTLKGGLLQHWVGTSPQTRQPRLDHHNVALHLGGAKRVSRDGEGRRYTVDVDPGALSVVPCGASYTWTTRGPVDFAHLYIEPRRLARVVVEEFDRDPGAVVLQESVGRSDPLLHRLYESMLDEIAEPGPSSSVCIESLYRAFLVRLLSTHSNLSDARRARYVLAPWRVRRVTDYVEENLGDELDLEILARAAGLSRYHFSRSFQRATGMAPCTFITRRRIEEAKRLLRERQLSIAEVAMKCGFASARQLSTSFRKSTGQSPSQYRAQY
jgi:AraC family transcriptional regulator